MVIVIVNGTVIVLVLVIVMVIIDSLLHYSAPGAVEDRSPA